MRYYSLRPIGEPTVDLDCKGAYNEAMRVINGKVVRGAVILEDATLEEGANVTVLVREDQETFDLNSEEEARLLEAIGDADRGDFLHAKDVLRGIERNG